MQFVDTNRYPLDRLDSAGGQSFLSECAATYAQVGALVLPGLVTPAGVSAIAREGRDRVGDAFISTGNHTVFLDSAWSGDDAAAGDETDPMTRPLRTSVGSIANDMIEPGGVLQQIYDWPPLTRFIGEVLGYQTFYQGADPLGALSINVYRAGDLHEWHFDESRFSVTLMVQEAELGGHFEFVTDLRSATDADLAGIAAVLDGDESSVQRLPFTAGSLSIFGGRNTMHRVTEVAGTRSRLVPVLTYDTQPGSVNSPAVRTLFWGRTS